MKIRQNGISENAIQDNSLGNIIIRNSAEIELVGEIQFSKFQTIELKSGNCLFAVCFFFVAAECAPV